MFVKLEKFTSLALYTLLAFEALPVPFSAPMEQYKIPFASNLRSCPEMVEPVGAPGKVTELNEVPLVLTKIPRLVARAMCDGEIGLQATRLMTVPTTELEATNTNVAGDVA